MKRIRLAWGLALASAALCASAAALLVASRTAAVQLDWSYRGFFAIAALSLVAVGWAIARHRPDNPIGWVFLLSGFSCSLNVFAEQYGVYGAVYRPGSLPAVGFVDWVGSLQWVFWIGILGVYGFLLFPDGRPLSRRWAVVGWVAPLGMATIVASLALRPGPLESLARAPNPFGTGLDAKALDRLQWAALPLFVGSLAMAATSLIVRLRRSTGPASQQIKWLVYAALPVPVTVGVGGIMSGSGPATGVAKVIQTFAIMALAGVPIGAAVGILRYRLYDIDRIINRTLVYAVVTTLLVVAYASLVFAFGAVLRPFTGGSDVAIAAATLATATAFGPLRRHVQSAVDRRFNRGRYDAERILASFSGSLREAVELDLLLTQLRAAVTTAMHPDRVDVWLPVERK